MLCINESLIHQIRELEATQFDYCNPYYKDRVWGLFGEQDTLAHLEPLLLQHYNNSYLCMSRHRNKRVDLPALW